MTVLFISQHVPWRRQGSQHGIFQRMRMLLDACAIAFDDVSLLLLAPAAAAPPPAERTAVRQDIEQTFGPRIAVRLELIGLESDTQPARDPGNRLISRYLGPDLFHLARHPQTARVIEQHIARIRPAVIFAHRLEIFAALKRAPSATTLPILMDLDDVEHLSYLRSILNPPYWWSKFLLLARLPGIVAQEFSALKTCRSVSVCSAHDIGKLPWLGRPANATTIPNAITDPRQAAASPGDPAPLPHVLFVGSFSHHPNRVGLRWFCTDVWPRVLATHPHLRLQVVGQHADTLDACVADSPGVEVLGFVDDLAPRYAQASVVICPILSGGGTRLKIIEACAHQRAVVSTGIGAEGLALEDGQGILIADRPQAFADCVVRLIDDPEARLRIAASARETFVRHYRRDAVVRLAANRLKAVRAALHASRDDAGQTAGRP